MEDVYDLCIIGAGSAGMEAAEFGSIIDARVALVEMDLVGGDCTWYGSVPSKALLKAARVAHCMRTAGEFGIDPVEPEIDLRRILERVRSVMMECYGRPEHYRRKGINFFQGKARFLDPHTITVEQQEVRARNFLIASGAKPIVPDIEGINTVNYHTNKTIWNLERLPEHLLIIGGGPAGVEFAQAFRRLGSQVTLLSDSSRLLPRDEPEAADVIARVLRHEGVNLRFKSKIARIEQDDNGIHLHAGNELIAGDALLVACGRTPALEELDLEKAGVGYNGKGIKIDSYLRTSQKHIYACGDCIGDYQYTHYAGWQAVKAVQNALGLGKTKAIAETVPWVTFTSPEIAHAGFTEEQAKTKYGKEVQFSIRYMCTEVRSRIEGDTLGFFKIVYRHDGTILGVTIVTERAGEMIQEWINAMDHGLLLADLAETMHVYPTYSQVGHSMAFHIALKKTLEKFHGRLPQGESICEVISC